MGCKCKCKGATSSQGAKGNAGATGSRGEYGGYSSDWVFNASTGSGPASTNIRLNNATPASVTKIFISNVNADSVDVTAIFKFIC